MISLSYTTDLVLTNEKLHIRFVINKMVQLEGTFRGYLIQLPDYFGTHQKLLRAVSKCPRHGERNAPAQPELGATGPQRAGPSSFQGP